jgi:hypothetical protein
MERVGTREKGVRSTVRGAVEEWGPRLVAGV